MESERKEVAGQSSCAEGHELARLDIDTQQQHDVLDQDEADRSVSQGLSNPFAAKCTRTPSLRTNVAVASMVGNILEFYDFGIFAYVAPQIGANFFPREDKTTGIINTFVVFGVAFIIRPLGGVVFGHIGDLFGRKVALQASVVLMGASTFSIGCLPTYAQAGFLAPLALSVARILQGLSVGGEYVGSLIYAVESAPPGKQVWAGSLCSFGVFVGMTLGSCTGFFLHKTMSEEEMYAYGWRIPFWCGIFIAGYSLWMRRTLDESDAFVESRKEAKATPRAHSPLIESLQTQPLSILLAFLVISAHSFAIWCILVFPPVLYLQLMDPPLGSDSSHREGADAHDAGDRVWLLNTLILLSVVIASPLSGLLGSLCDVRSSLLWGNLALAAAALPCALAMGSGDLPTAMAAQTTLAQINAWLGANLPAFLVQSFPVRVRYSSLAVGYNAATGLFGGTAGIVATFLFREYGSMVAVGSYMAFLACVSSAAVAVCNLRARRHEALGASLDTPSSTD